MALPFHVAGVRRGLRRSPLKGHDSIDIRSLQGAAESSQGGDRLYPLEDLPRSLAEYRPPEGLDPATRHARLMSGSATLGAPRPSPRREAWPDSCDGRQPRGRLRPRPYQAAGGSEPGAAVDQAPSRARGPAEE